MNHNHLCFMILGIQLFVLQFWFRPITSIRGGFSACLGAKLSQHSLSSLCELVAEFTYILWKFDFGIVRLNGVCGALSKNFL